MKPSHFCLLVLSLSSVAQAAPPPQVTVPVEGLSPDGSYSAGTNPGDYFHWTNRSWGTSDTAYLDIRKSIDAEIKAGRSAHDLVSKYREAALLLPTDALAQFRWAYAAFRAFQARWDTGKNESSIIEGVREGMERPKEGTDSYEYTRIRVIMHQWDEQWVGNGFIEKCGLRLLEQNPDDEDLKLALLGPMSFTSRSIEDQDRAYEWAKGYYSKYSETARAKYVLGFVLGNRLDRIQSQAMADEALSLLKKSQSMLTPTHLYYRRAQDQIDFVQKATIVLKKAGKLKP